MDLTEHYPCLLCEFTTRGCRMTNEEVDGDKNENFLLYI